MKNIYEHFHRDEYSFVDRALEWVENAKQRHEQRLTDFLDPRQQAILQSIVNREVDVQVVFNGGYAEAERSRAIIAPAYAYLDDAFFDIQVLAISSEDHHFPRLEHGDFLGAVLALGIKREKIGDIHVHDHHCHMLIAEGMSDFAHLQLQSVHRAKVMTELLPIEQLDIVQNKFEEMRFTVASPRLDGIVSDAWRLSRSKVLPPIKAGRCKVNWKVVEDPSTVLQEGDVVSLQGFGRFKILELGGQTKSGRLKVHIGRYC